MPMFALEVDEDLQVVVETVRKLVVEELAPKLRESERRRDIEPRLREVFEEIGLAALELPPELDGAGMGCLARALVNEELAAGDAGAALALDGYGPAVTALLEVGGVAAAGALVSALDASGGRALLVLEDDARVEITGDTIEVATPWIPADRAAAIVVLGREQALLIREGIELEPVRGAGLRAAGASSLRVRGAPIAGRWSSPRGADRARARARLYFASLLLGVMRATCEFSAAYAQERQAFGKPIAHHQALAFLIVDMRMALDAARLVVLEAAWRVDQGLPCAVEAASAWAECIEASRTIGPNGVQILGGHGFMADYPVEKHMRESRALGLACGGFDAAVDEAGRSLCESAHPLALRSEGSL
jgi:alkylation response protein AidB-like acyl-CoA dehydrogenase